MGHTKMTKVVSSQLEEIGYDAENQRLFIRFKGHGRPGSLYSYENFTQAQYDAFVAAESKGRWFGQNLKDKKAEHPYKRVVEAN